MRNLLIVKLAILAALCVPAVALATYYHLQYGDEHTATNDATDDGTYRFTDLEDGSDSDSVAWARFDYNPYNCAPTHIGIGIDVDYSAVNYFVDVWNETDQRWEPHGPMTGDTGFSLGNDPTDYFISGTGFRIKVVITSGTKRLNSVTFDWECT